MVANRAHYLCSNVGTANTCGTDGREMAQLAFQVGSLQQRAALKLDHRQYKLLPEILRPHVVQTICASLLCRLRPNLIIPDRLTITGEEPDTRVYGQKRKYSDISRAEVTFTEFFG